jgi:hypothetical protein
MSSKLCQTIRATAVELVQALGPKSGTTPADVDLERALALRTPDCIQSYGHAHFASDGEHAPFDKESLVEHLRATAPKFETWRAVMSL